MNNDQQTSYCYYSCGEFGSPQLNNTSLTGVYFWNAYTSKNRTKMNAADLRHNAHAEYLFKVFPSE